MPKNHSQDNESVPNLSSIVSRVDEHYLNISKIGANIFEKDKNLEEGIIQLQEKVAGLSNLTEKMDQYLERSNRNDNVILIFLYVITGVLGFVVIMCFFIYCIIFMQRQKRYKNESLPNDQCEIPLKETMQCKIYNENGSKETVEYNDLYDIAANKC